MFQEHSWRNGCSAALPRLLLHVCGLKAVSLLQWRPGRLTHGVAVEQEDSVRGPPVLHQQVERVGSIEVGLLLCGSRKHQVRQKQQRCGVCERSRGRSSASTPSEGRLWPTG